MGHEGKLYPNEAGISAAFAVKQGSDEERQAPELSDEQIEMDENCW